MKNLFYFTLRLLVIALCIGSAAQVHAITIKVQKGGTAPYLYAYLGSGDNATILTGNWPGTQFTNKDDNGFWTMDIPNQTTVNLILNMGDGKPQTGNILNVAGILGVAKFMYDGNTNCYTILPQLGNDDGYIYFNCPPDWGNYNEDGHRPYVYFLDSNDNQLGVNGWPGWEMTYVGLDGGGFQIYKYRTDNWNGISKLIFNSGSNAHQTGNLYYVANGYYNTDGCQTTTHKLSSSNGYTDGNFRSSIASQLGIQDGNVFIPNNVTYLDVSNQGISSLAGINNFSHLQTLIANNNNISRADLGSNANLEILDFNSNSSSLIGPSAYSGEGHITFAHNAPLKYLDLSNNSGLTYFSAIYNTYGINTLDTLKLSNVPLGWPSAITHQSNLTYLDLNNSNLKSTDEVNLTALTNLKYLDLSNNSNLKKDKLTVPSSLPSLKTLKLNGCTNLSRNSEHGGSIDLSPFSALEILEFNNVDLMTSTIVGTISSAKSTLKSIDFSNDQMVNPSLSGFTALETLNASNNTTLHLLTLSNCPAIESIDVSGSMNMTEIALVNQGYSNANFTLPTITATGCDALHILNLSDNSFTSVPELPNVPSTIQSLKLNNNNLSSLTMPAGSPIQFLYAENNAGFTGNYELTSAAAGQLKGLDLGNNGFTSFKAEGTALSALMIGNNTSLTSLELHGNNNLTCTTAETTMSEGSGLYLLGNTNLVTINIENSKFNNIGANKSLEGLTKVTTLRAAHNEFETFTNSNYDAPNHDARSHTLASIVGKPSLEDLTGLVYLDLSNNLLKDSVHLYRNTALKYLDVSHNQILGNLPANNTEREAMINKKLTTCLKYGVGINGDSVNHYIGPVGKSIELTDDIKALLTRYDPYRQEYRYADFRPCDLRDTVGLYHLDLHYNTLLEYLDISYTNIHNTAAGRKYMNPGWESSPDGWEGQASTYHPNPEYGPVKHHFVLMREAPNLRVFKADHNNMQSLGTAMNHQIDTLSATHMYGDCHFMANHSYDDYIGYGSKGFDGDNCHNARYVDLSYGSFYSIDPQHLSSIEKLIVTGNPLGGGKYPNYVLEVSNTNNPSLEVLKANQCTDLQTIEAHDMNHLAILDVSGNTALKTLRAYNDPVLYDAQTSTENKFITGLTSCSALEELWVSNDNLPELEVWNNKQLNTLKCYDNATLPTLDLHENTLLSYLDFHNCMLNSIDLSKNTALTYIDCSSPSVATNIGETGKNKLSDLEVNSNVIATVIANCNDLHSIKGVNKSTLTRLEFEHNHINGIDLSGTSLTAETLKDADNGRTIEGDYSIITIKDGSNTTKYDLYFFQLDNTVTGGGTFIGNKASVDVLKGEPRDVLSIEGMQANKITAWTANAVPLTSGSKSPNNYVDPHNLNGIIDPDEVIGTIVVLDEHNKHSEYTYNTGVSGHTSTYYLDWSAPSVVTAVTDIEIDDKPSVTGGIGAVTIQAPEGTIVGIFDMAGRLVQQITANGSEMVIDGMAPGVYIVNGQKVIVK